MAAKREIDRVYLYISKTNSKWLAGKSGKLGMPKSTIVNRIFNQLRKDKTILEAALNVSNAIKS